MSTAPQWDHWLNAFEWDIRDAVCLSLNLEPRDPATRSLLQDYRPSMRFRDRPIHPLYDRLSQVIREIERLTFPFSMGVMGHPLAASVTPEDFVGWATNASWQLPASMQAIERSREKQKENAKATTCELSRNTEQV